MQAHYTFGFIGLLNRTWYRSSSSTLNWFEVWLTFLEIGCGASDRLFSLINRWFFIYVVRRLRWLKYAFVIARELTKFCLQIRKFFKSLRSSGNLFFNGRILLLCNFDPIFSQFVVLLQNACRLFPKMGVSFNFLKLCHQSLLNALI